MANIGSSIYAQPIMKLANRGGKWNRRILFFDDTKLGYYSKVPTDYIANTLPEKPFPKQC